MRTSLITSGLRSAINREHRPRNLILHSDRGSQYASDEYRYLIKQHNIKQNMSRRGNCWDNAPMESFFDSLKCEHVHHQRFKNAEDARRSLFEWIEIFYNKKRMHSSLNYQSPCCFEKKIVAQAA